MKRLIEIGGWVGVCIIVGAFAAITLGFAQANSFAYLVFNVVGSALLGIDAYAQKNYQPVVLQIIWATVAIIALVRLF